MASHGSDNTLCLGGGVLHWLNGLSSQEGSLLLLLLLPLLPDGSQKTQRVKIIHIEVTEKNCVSPITVCISVHPLPEVSTIFFPINKFSLSKSNA